MESEANEENVMAIDSSNAYGDGVVLKPSRIMLPHHHVLISTLKEWTQQLLVRQLKYDHTRGKILIILYLFLLKAHDMRHSQTEKRITKTRTNERCDQIDESSIHF